MPRFLTGDELGSIKSLSYVLSPKAESKATVTTLYDGSGKAKERAVQKLAATTSENGPLIAVARSDGSTSVSQIQAQGLEMLREWTEPRLKPGQRYVGLAATSAGVYSCTSNGALRLTPLGDANTNTNTERPRTAVLPMRLCDWRLAPDGATFSYGGDEVELSVANDSLSLRQPVHNTCLTYLSSTTSQQLLAGTQRGDIRRYDTRAARKPVAEWKQIVPAAASHSGVGGVQKGFHDNEVFVSDQKSNLFAVDTRNGRVVYGYKGIAGAVTSMAQAGRPQDDKGTVLEKVYMKSIPTCVVWDGIRRGSGGSDDDGDGGDDDDEDVWEAMPAAEDSEDESETQARRAGRK
ncbi:hypothetical protein BC826DRAFT_987995 [Russula brevipes]|nr:hypothetical protein BC826DRAFT_987995 [Russula brevipes]